MFRFDQKILEDEYVYYYRRVHNKFRGLLEINNRGQELLAEIRQGKSTSLRVDMFREAEELYPLSTNYRNAQSDFNKYFGEETEGFYQNSVQDWQEYISSGR